MQLQYLIAEGISTLYGTVSRTFCRSVSRQFYGLLVISPFFSLIQTNLFIIKNACRHFLKYINCFVFQTLPSTAVAPVAIEAKTTTAAKDVVEIPRGDSSAPNRFYFGMNGPAVGGGGHNAAAVDGRTAVGKVRDNETLAQPFRKPRYQLNPSLCRPYMTCVGFVIQIGEKMPCYVLTKDCILFPLFCL
jgi:hypothetical protein